MWWLMVVLVPVLLPTLVVKTISCANDTSSDVFVRYSHHADATVYSPEARIVSFSVPITEATEKVTTPMIVATNPPTIFYQRLTTKATTTTTSQPLPEETEGVVFIPNVAPVTRIQDVEDEKRGLKLEDLLQKKTVNDVLDKHFRLETEAPNEIVFLAHKNRDSVEDKSREEKKPRGKKHRIKEEEVVTTPSLDCSNLDCNNTIKSICGGKTINRDWHYRLFLNECYFRKVNCNFKYESNRYEEVPLERCQPVGAHFEERPFAFKPRYYDKPKEKRVSGSRRSFSSRRSMAMNMNGQFCSHPCPVACPDDYEPECAVSATGQRKVFMNHCKLDDNSCLFGVVWHKRPLSECVGGKKADVRQNRFFIGWMQRVGIIDNKGKLVME